MRDLFRIRRVPAWRDVRGRPGGQFCASPEKSVIFSGAVCSSTVRPGRIPAHAGSPRRGSLPGVPGSFICAVRRIAGRQGSPGVPTLRGGKRGCASLPPLLCLFSPVSLLRRAPPIPAQTPLTRREGSPDPRRRPVRPCGDSQGDDGVSLRPGRCAAVSPRTGLSALRAGTAESGR